MFLSILAFLIGSGTQIEFYASLLEPFVGEPLDVNRLVQFQRASEFRANPGVPR